MAKSILDSVRTNGVFGSIKKIASEGWLWSILDGNLLQTKMRQLGGAKLVGEDKFGNKYYENMANTQYGRHRWVEFGSKTDYNASSVPPEWHGWLHHITDNTPEKIADLKPSYAQPHRINLSGLTEEGIYRPKGYPKNQKQRDWKRFEPWNPS
eukprot:TRINITY_DN12265_c0_g1_i1.p1 TRINITY_DN12265_c0_g1~~TRINITY_DN12265_c0_g1_i1.p1  ORF type:complete len:153 (+),score=25.73 TRINITY_DN12265_c0_g1_i1:115-573(+)